MKIRYSLDLEFKKSNDERVKKYHQSPEGKQKLREYYLKNREFILARSKTPEYRAMAKSNRQKESFKVWHRHYEKMRRIRKKEGFN